MLAAECVSELAVLRTQRSTNLTAECAWTLLEDTITHIYPCGYSICRECVCSLIVSQIESRRFPVMCPTCGETARRRLEVSLIAVGMHS